MIGNLGPALGLHWEILSHLFHTATSIEVLEDGAAQPRTLSLFPEDRCVAALADASTVHVCKTCQKQTGTAFRIETENRS